MGRAIFVYIGFEATGLSEWAWKVRVDRQDDWASSMAQQCREIEDEDHLAKTA